MSDPAQTFLPLATGEISAPIVESPRGEGAGQDLLPRILLQAALSGRAARNLLLLSGVFLLFAGLEAGLYGSLPEVTSQVVYLETPRQLLIGVSP